MTAARWLPAPPSPSLRGGEVHVWRVPLAPSAPEAERLAGLLDAGERDRAARFRRPDDRRRFEVAHGALRVVLGRYLRHEPRRLRFSRNPGTKPELTDGAGLHFNLSRSHDLALVAVARNLELGVDIERVHPDLASRQLAERLFGAEDLDVLSNAPPHAWPEAFFRAWTRYEAGLKARGLGLGVEPSPPRFRPADVGGWRCLDLEPGPGYRAALAVEVPTGAVRCWDWRANRPA